MNSNCKEMWKDNLIKDKESYYELKVPAGTYFSNNMFSLIWEVFTHRLWHLIKHRRWMD